MNNTIFGKHLAAPSGTTSYIYGNKVSSQHGHIITQNQDVYYHRTPAGNVVENRWTPEYGLNRVMGPGYRY